MHGSVTEKVKEFGEMCRTYFTRHFPADADAVAVLRVTGNLSVFVHDALDKIFEIGKQEGIRTANSGRAMYEIGRKEERIAILKYITSQEYKRLSPDDIYSYINAHTLVVWLQERSEADHV